jgi:hypothetical protein
MLNDIHIHDTCQTPSNLDLYPPIDKSELKKVDAEFQAEVGYWASTNHLQDYKIYGTLIKMFKPEFLNNLLQPPIDNPWLANMTNIIFKT